MRPTIVLLLIGLGLAAAAPPAAGQRSDRRTSFRPVPRLAAAGDQRPRLRPSRARPVRHVHTDGCRRWVPPCGQTVTERVWVPPRCERVWVPPVFRLERDRCGRTRQVILQAGYWQTVRHPGFWDTRCREVIVPGRWEQVCGHPEGR